MARTMKVNGPASILVSSQNGTSFADLGISDRGVRIRLSHNVQDVVTDASGPTPADTQVFPETAILRFRLVSWEESVLEYLRTLVIGGKTYLPGQVVPPGVLLGANGATKAIRIHNPYGDRPWVFPYCRLAQETEINLGTERTGYEITLAAISGIGSNVDPGGLQSGNNQCLLYYRPTQ